MDKSIPIVPIKLDKERHLRFSIGAIIRFKEVTGKDLRDPEVNKQIQEKISLEDLRAFIWACLRHEDKTLMLEDVGDMIDFNNIEEITQTLRNAITVSMPDKKEESSPLASSLNG